MAVVVDYESTNGEPAAIDLPKPDRIPIDLPEIPDLPILPRFGASGFYELRRWPILPTPFPLSPTGAEEGDDEDFESISILNLNSEQLRLDVDGRYPLMTASGTSFRLLKKRSHWIAKLKKTGPSKWSGPIWYKEGDPFLHTKVDIAVSASLIPSMRKATITFSGGGLPNRTVTLPFKSQYFHDVNFEYDCAAGTTAVTTVNTGAHPNRPATLPTENLSIETVFRRSGFNVSRSGDNVVPIAGAGANARWNDAEMHDAMQTYWSKFGNKAQWAMWVFFASLHEMGTGLGGIMFDDIGPNHRQGTAIFNDSFIKNAPAGDPNAAAWVQRMRFWTAVHEMGHGFNLAHSWQKALGTPWIPLANTPEARSFMNYPYSVSGGQTAFFANFDYRFDNNELLFMRHAPSQFVQMGNADWFDHHGFQQANVSPEPTFNLEVRANRPKPTFEFLEPVVIEAKLTNTSGSPQVIDKNILTGHDITVIIKKEGQPAREFRPYANRCFQPEGVAIAPGQSQYESMYVSSGIGGWNISEPGRYLVQIALHLENEDVVSNEFVLKVTPPLDRQEEFLAQDYFVDEVGRVLYFDGSLFFQEANDTLREVTERMPDRAAAAHAAMALARPQTSPFKDLQIPGDRTESTCAGAEGAKIVQRKPDLKGAKATLEKVLIKNASRSAETLGHIDYKWYVDQSSQALFDQDDTASAVKLQQTLLKTLTDRKVLPSVLDDVKSRITQLEKKSPLR